MVTVCAFVMNRQAPLVVCVALLLLYVSACGGGGSTAALNEKPAKPASILDQPCGDETGAGLLSSVKSEYKTTLKPSDGIDLPAALPLTIRLTYNGGAVTCYPRQDPPPGSLMPIIGERVGVVVDVQFLTEDGSFAEMFEAELKGGSGGGDLSFSRLPEELQGTYRPDLPDYQGVVVGFYGRFANEWTNGVVSASGQRPGQVSEYIPLAYWQPEAAPNLK